MKADINQYLKDGLPNLYPFGVKDNELKSEWRGNALLKRVGECCSKNLGDAKATEILILISSLYRTGNLFIRNTIENEFLSVVANQMEMADMMVYLKEMPENLQIYFLKVLLEIKKTK